MIRFLFGAVALVFSAATAAAQQPVRLLNAPCTADAANPVTEPQTGRTFFLDYPCDLGVGEAFTFVLSLHGGGSSHTWQRRYFPAFDFKERQRLVIATPYSPTRRWSDADDAYLQHIVTSVIEQAGRANIRAFWLAGHSQGGATSRRLVCTDFFRTKVDGFLSLSGGRLGGAPDRARNAGRPPQMGETPATPAAPADTPGLASPDPTCDFSHVFAIGEHEIAALPATSAWAQKYGCAPRAQSPDIVDVKGGYVHDGSRQNPGSKAWGLLPRPGRAEMFTYSNCAAGRVVSDVVRMDKGHTEGLEPQVTEALIRVMLSATGGKVQRGG